MKTFSLSGLGKIRGSDRSDSNSDWLLYGQGSICSLLSQTLGLGNDVGYARVRVRGSEE